MDFRKILLLNIILAFFSPTHANETMNPIVVGNSISPIDIHTSPVSMEVFTSSDIEVRGFADMQELLSSISSINITSNGGIGQLTSIFTRGTESNHTKIILDGVELNPGTLALAPIQNISIDSIDRIEIIKGSSSALHGARTIGGIINIKTKENSNSIKISSGSWSTNTTSLSQNFNLNGLNMNINADRKESKSKAAGRYSTKRHAYNTNNITIGLRKEKNDYIFSSKLYNSYGNTQYDNFGTNENQDHDDYFYNFGVKKFINDDIFEMIIIGSQNRIIQKKVGSNDFTDTLRDIYDFSYTSVGSNVVQKFGVVYTKEHMSELVYGGTAYESRFTAQHNNKEYFYQNEMSYPSYKLNFGARHTDHSQAGHFTSGNFGVSLLLDNDVYSFNLTKSYRPADATDLYATDGSGNTTHKPEESLSYEFGVKRYVNKNTFMRGAFFKTRLKNLIEADINSQIYLSDALITGFEMRMQTDMHPFTYDIGYTYMTPEDTKNNQPLTKRSKHKLNADVIYKYRPNSSIRFNILAEGTRKASAFADLNLGSYYIANVNYRTRLDKGIISLSMKNIFDRSYRTAHGYNALDRSLFVTYTLEY